MAIGETAALKHIVNISLQRYQRDSEPFLKGARLPNHSQRQEGYKNT